MDRQNKVCSRRKFVKIAGGIVVGVSGLYVFLPKLRFLSQKTVSLAKAAIVGPYLPMGDTDPYIRQIITRDSMDSRTIMWQSEQEEQEEVLEYRVRGTEIPEASQVVNEKFTDDNVTVYLHTTVLTGLQSATHYEYRIGCGKKRSDWHNLTTAGTASLKALIFPDSQSSDYTDWENLAQFAYRVNPDAVFFINMGDLVDNGEDRTQWQAWFNALNGIIDTIPVVPVMGNHETYTKDWKVRMPEAYLHYFALPENGDDMRKNQYYSFDYGDVHFIVLTTQIDEMETLQPGLLEEEQAWFKADITKTQKKWKIILMHKDVLQYANKKRPDHLAGISDIGRAFMPLFDKYNVDVVLTAHLHTYRRRDHIYDFQPDTKGPMYIITGVAGNVRYPNLWKDHPFDKVKAPQPETDNFMTLEASFDRLRLAAYLPNGDEIDHVELNK
jgi:hypothetical protein